MPGPGGLRVLIVSPDYPPARGGIQTLIGTLAQRLPVAGVRVVTFAAPGCEAYDAAREVAVRRVRWGSGKRRLRIAALSARALLEAWRNRPDVVLLGHVAAAPIGALLRTVLRIPVVTYVHAEEFRVWPRRCGFAMRHCDAVIAVSRHTLAMARAAGADPEALHLIHHGVDLPAPGEDARAGQPPTLITVARMQDPHKGHDVLLRAMPLVLERVPEARWVVLGDGRLRAGYEQEAARLGIAGAVTFTGAVSDAERDAWLRRAHVFAMPTRVPDGGLGGEGFGIAYLEAAAYGLPVLAAAEGGALDAVDDGRTGLLVDPRDPVQVGDALCGLLGDPARAAAMSASALEWAARFPWQATVAQVAEVLSAAADGRRAIRRPVNGSAAESGAAR